jgi:hypothetical protein
MGSFPVAGPEVAIIDKIVDGRGGFNLRLITLLCHSLQS